MRRLIATRLIALAGVAVLAVACGGGTPTGPTPSTTTTTSIGQSSGETLVGAGDIAMCGSAGTVATARLLDGIPGTVFTAGDNAYMRGSASDFRNCYDPTWGRHLDRTRPSPGNHDYETPNATGYFDYFGENAGPYGRGYYSFDLGAWHILSLNSNIPTGAGSPQYAFVTRDLVTNAATCTLAIWHHPLFSSGQNGPSRFMADIFRALYDGNVELVINGHDHWYERFAPQTADAVPDTSRGIRQIVVGTGGAEQTGLRALSPNSEVRITSFGVLRLNLFAGGYDAAFIQPSGTIADFVTGRCH